MTSALHNPKIIGPGTWYMLHSQTAEANSNEDMLDCIKTIDRIKKLFPCLKCRKHFNEFCEKDPPQRHIRDKEDLFKWTWRAHRNANELAGSSSITYEEAKKLYFNPDVCTK